ncbi:hypothetical protein GQ457_10G013100 [Hibiscus cannabinus]
MSVPSVSFGDLAFTSAPGSLLYRTLRAKYFPDGDLFSASAPARLLLLGKAFIEIPLPCREFMVPGKPVGIMPNFWPICSPGTWIATRVLSLCCFPSFGAFGGIVTLGCMSAPSILYILSLRTLFCSVLTMHQRSIKVNVDGAFLPSARLGAIGVIARDSSGAVLGGFAKPVPVHGPASTMEDSALFAGLEFPIANAWPSP